MATIDSTRDGTATQDATSAGMPSIPARHDGLEAVGDHAEKIRANAGEKVRSIIDEGKVQITQTLDGLVDTARDLAAKLESVGVGPVASYAHQAADYVAGWSAAVNDKSLEDLVDDARSLVRTNPAIAVGLAVVGGFVLSRLFKGTPQTSYGRGF